LNISDYMVRVKYMQNRCPTITKKVCPYCNMLLTFDNLYDSVLHKLCCADMLDIIKILHKEGHLYG